MREDHILDRLHPWLAATFDPPALTATIEAMAIAQETPAEAQVLAAAKSVLA